MGLPTTAPAVIAFYQQAASVQALTGVDPAIVTTIANTESDLSLHPISLGITTGAPGARGSSGQVVYPNVQTPGQPSSFWAYSNGAEAAQAFASYLKTGPASIQALAPLAGSAGAFFNPAGPGPASNYFVPKASEIQNAGSDFQARLKYWSDWNNYASKLSSQFGTFDPTLPPIEVLIPGIQPAPAGTPQTPEQANPDAFGLLNPNFGPSVLHLLTSVGLVLLALVILIGGFLMLKGH